MHPVYSEDLKRSTVMSGHDLAFKSPHLPRTDFTLSEFRCRSGSLNLSRSVMIYSSFRSRPF